MQDIATKILAVLDGVDSDTIWLYCPDVSPRQNYDALLTFVRQSREVHLLTMGEVPMVTALEVYEDGSPVIVDSAIAENYNSGFAHLLSDN